MTESNRGFQGIWIPKEVWLDTRLSAIEKVLFAEIQSLASGSKGCFASNNYFKNFLGCSINSVTNYIGRLVELGFIVTHFDGMKRYIKLERRDYPKNETDTVSVPHILGDVPQDLNEASQNLGEGITNFGGDSPKNWGHINTGINTSINLDNTVPTGLPDPNQQQQQEQRQDNMPSPYKQIVDLYFILFQEYSGKPPTFGAVEGKMLKTLLGKQNGEIIKKTMREYFRPNNGLWFCKGGGLDLKHFISNFDKVSIKDSHVETIEEMAIRESLERR